MNTDAKKNSKKISPLKAGLAGMAMGAAGAAAAITFSKKENRDKASKKVNELKGKAENKLEDLNKKIDDLSKHAKKEAEEKKLKAKEASDKIDKEYHQTVENM
jgi:peptidoglycan hydrolase CwlO-like protein